MKRYSVLIALLLVMSFGLAQRKINDGMYRYNLSFTLSKTNFVDTIPIVFSDDQVYIPVMIDGQKRMFNLESGYFYYIMIIAKALQTKALAIFLFSICSIFAPFLLDKSRFISA